MEKCAVPSSGHVSEAHREVEATAGDLGSSDLSFKIP